MLFELLGLMEYYHPRMQLRLQLARIMILNMLNLYSLIFALFRKINRMTEELATLKIEVLNNSTLPVNSSVILQTDNDFGSGYDKSMVTGIMILLTTLSPNTTIMRPFNDSSMLQNATDPLTTEAQITFHYDYTNYDYFEKNESNQKNQEDLEDIDFTTDQSLINMTLGNTAIFEDLEDNYYFNNTNSTHILSTSIMDNSTSIENFTNLTNSTDGFIEEVFPIAEFLKSESDLVVEKKESRRSKLRKLCWETMFGQELMKLTVMDLVNSLQYFNKFIIMSRYF